MSLLQRISNLERSGLADAAKYSSQTSPGIEYKYVKYRWGQFAVHFVIALISFSGLFPCLELGRAHGKYHGTLGWKRHAHQPWYYPKWFLYLTSWSLFANMVQSLIGAVAVNKAVSRWQMPEPGLTTYGVSNLVWNAYCVLYSVALNLSVLTLMEIWVLIFPPSDNMKDSVHIDVFTLLGLFIGTVAMLVDLFAVKFMYKMITGLYSLVALMAYFGITKVHYDMKAHGRGHDRHYIYPKLDWANNSRTVEVIGISVFILEVINFMILWWLCQLKKKVMVIRESGEPSPSRRTSPESDHPGEPLQKTRTSDNRGNSPSEDLDAQIKDLQEHLARLEHQFKKNSKDGKTADEIAQLQEALNNKIRERDARKQKHE